MPVPCSSSTRVIALMNQKGGVGKTTTTVNLAAGIAELGKRVLVVDLDPQSHASLHLGVDPATFPPRSEIRARSIYDLLADPTLDATPALRVINPNLSVLAAETDLAALETELSDIEPAQRTTRLGAVLDKLNGKVGGFDYVLIDCPPSLGVLTLNGLAAAREVLIPMQAHFLALQGVSKLLETVQLVGRTVNPHLRVAGVVLCMHDPASSHVKEVVQDMVSFFERANVSDVTVPWKGAKVYQPPVRRNIKLAECPSFGQTIFQYAPFCPGALDYKALAAAIAAEWMPASSPSAPAAAAVATPASAPIAAEPKPAPAVTTRRPPRSAQSAGKSAAETGA